MRKHFLLIALAGLTVLAACNKQKESQGVAQFTATIEHQGGRTSLDPNNGQINWTAGDQIVIGNDNGETAVFTLQSGEGTTEGGFGTTGEFNTVGPFVAAYPSDAIIENDKVTYNLPATQAIGETGTFANGANPMVAYSDNKNLQFKNLCGGLGIRLKGVGAHVSAVRITSKNTSEKLWGAYEVSNCASNEPMLTEASGNQGSNVITLSCEVTLTTAAKTFFVMLPPGTLANGFTMEVLDGDEVLVTKETDSDVAFVERNNVKVFNEILIDVEFDGNVEIPTGMTGADIIVTNLGEDAVPDENGDFFIGYSKMLTAKNATNNEIIYMSVLSVDYDIAKGESQSQSYDLNAKETALYYALTMIPFGLSQTQDATFQSIKNVLYDLDCVQALENAITQSVNQNGYLRAEDIGDELNTVWNYLRDELLAPFLDKQSSDSGSNEGRIVLKKDGTARLEQPQIQPNNGRLSGIRLDIESANFNETSNTWTLNLTGYSDNGVFIGINKGSIVDGLAHPTGGRTPYFIPPMNVGKFMGTFTSLGGLKDYFVDTWRLITEDDFWFDDMTWDMAKLNNITFELNSNEGALIMISPKDDRPTAVVNTVYAIMYAVGAALDDILTVEGYSTFFTSLFSDQELCASLAGLVGHPENFKTVGMSLLSWSIDFFSSPSNYPFINPKYQVNKLLDKLVSSTTRAAIEYVGNGLGTLASWCLFDSFYFTVDAEYNYEPPVLPQLTTDSYEVLSSTQATVTGTLINAGTYDIAERGICYGTSPNPTLNNSRVVAEGTGTGTFTCTLQGLTPYTTYYARAYAKNWSEMVGYGEEVSFKTYSAVPVLTTYPVENVTSTSAVFRGKVEEVASNTVLIRGFLYNTSPYVNIDQPGVMSVDAVGGGTGEFTATATGLSPNTTYYYVAYVGTDQEETFHGPELSFTTLPNGGGQSFIITATANPTNGGTVNGGGTYSQGQSCTVMATANTGYTFTNWTENGTAVSTNANYTFTVSGDRTLVANFTANGGGNGNVPTGAINGLFSVSDTQQVYFSQGNLQYQASTNTWRFAEHQWDYVGDESKGTVYENGVKCDNSNVSPTYSGWIDFYCWSTGDNPTATYIHQASSFTDWGINAISNGANQSGLWRTLGNDEWNYLLNMRSTTSGIRYVKGRVNNENGVIILPDNWTSSIHSLNNINPGLQQSSFYGDSFYDDNIITITEWINIFETNGAVFLPACGYRHYGGSCGYNGLTIVDAGSFGDYWTSTVDESFVWYGFKAHRITFGITFCDAWTVGFGRSVRLVRNAE